MNTSPPSGVTVFFFLLFLISDEHNARSGPLEASFSPQVLAHYPDNVEGVPFDSSAVTTVSIFLFL